MNRSLAVVSGALCACLGCSITASGQYGRTASLGNRVLPEGQGNEWGLAYGSRVHPRKYAPLAIGVEGMIGANTRHDGALRRFTALVGLSQLPVGVQSRFGYEGFFTLSSGGYAVDGSAPVTQGAGFRFGAPFRLFTPFAKPCVDSPFAAVTVLLAPEFGLQVQRPTVTDDVPIQAYFMLSLRFHGWSTLLDL